ncbi:MAG: GntR family transcriptional regulator [Actinomycetota bacterium]|nr:GntR family transcriptional regulator [Actinomycetota bacterium]
MTSSEVIRPIETISLPELVTVELRRAILSGRLAPGSSFSLRKIADMLDVSFIPVREALRNLESEGLVITRPGHSARVAPLDLEELQAIYRLRRQLEPEIGRRSCQLLKPGELDLLAQAAIKFGDEIRTMDEIYEDHHAFHFALFEPATTAWDERILATLWRAAERYIRIGFGLLDLSPAEHKRREEAHEDLIDAFRTRDQDVVEQAVRDHLDHNEQIALRALRDQPAALGPTKDGSAPSAVPDGASATTRSDREEHGRNPA